MKQELGGPCLSAVFVDYDNIYLSLRRKSEEAAKRFARDAGVWLKEIESGALITSTNGPGSPGQRRLVMNRCYGNPQPRRNANDNSTDMNSFPFVRHHFLRSGFEIVDCPPLTAQLKNSSDIRMVMDVRDHLTHDTHFGEFIILSGDADFTPVLHRLRAHARRTVIFANDYTAAPYTAICDGEVREADLISLLLDGRVSRTGEYGAAGAVPHGRDADGLRRDILTEVVHSVRAAGGAPVALEVLAERAMRALGHEKTAGTSWAGSGSFRDLLARGLPADIRMTDRPPYAAYAEGLRAASPDAVFAERRGMAPERAALAAPRGTGEGSKLQATLPASLGDLKPRSSAPSASAPPPAPTPARAQPGQALARTTDRAAAIQQSIARIHDACQAPPLSPPEYRLLFEVMAREIAEHGVQGSKTLANIVARAHSAGLEARHDDVRFVLDVVNEADPWFEKGASANLFAGRFRNFVVARCHSQSVSLSAEELELIETWFAGGATQAASESTGDATSRSASALGAGQPVGPGANGAGAAARRPSAAGPPSAPAANEAGGAPQQPRGNRWWGAAGTQIPLGQPMAAVAEAAAAAAVAAEGNPDEFPRIVRTRVRG